MFKSGKTVLSATLATLCCFSLLFCYESAISQTVESYYPAAFALVGATRYASGSVSDLQSSDDVRMSFQSYPSMSSPESMYAHQETVNIAGTEYLVTSLDMADSAGTNLSAPLASPGRSLLGRFVYPLTGITTIPSSTWTFYYRACFSNISEEVSISSPSWVQNPIWSNAEYAYSQDDAYAYSSNPGAAQRYHLYGFDLPSTANITKVEVGYEAYTAGDEGIGVSLSWDGGVNWTAAYNSPPLGTSDPDMVSWVDLTAAANWTASTLSDANFLSRVTVNRVGSATDDVFLDWLPVRVTYVSNPPTALMDVNIRIRRSTGTIRQTLAWGVGDSGSLSTNFQTLAGTYDWLDYTVINETDYLEIDYYVNVSGASPSAVVYLIIDDWDLVMADQTRITGAMLPSEYTAEVELSAPSNTDDWSKLVWTIESSWTTDHVSVTLQLHEYSLGTYPTIGDGYIAFLSSSVPDTDETRTQAITANTTNFRDYSGNWKMKIKGVKPATSPFSFKLDLSVFETTPVVHHDIAVSSITYFPTSIYPQDMVAVNVTVKNEGETSESFDVTSYFDDSQIGKQAISNLSQNESALLTFYWNTTGMSPGSYTLRAVANTVPSEDDVTDNVFIYGLVRIKGRPVASFTYSPESPTIGETVTFNASLSVSEGDSITSYRWDLGDGNLTITDSSIMTHTYANAGNYTVVLNITNSDGFWSIDSRTTSIVPQPVAPSSPWNWTWALLCIPFLTLLLAGVGWKKRGNKRQHVGIEFLNRITEGGIPDSFSVMLVGGSDSGKSHLFQELLHEFLKNEKPCVYVAYECFPDEIRKNMKKFQWDTSTLESQGKLSFIDCFSSSAKVQSKEKYFLTQPFSLVDLGIVISKATNEAGNGVGVFLDSTTSLLTQLDPARVVDFLQDRIARVKGVNGNLVFTSNKECMDPAMMSRLEETVDCIIELDASQVKGIAVRRLRIKKMRGRNYFDRWTQFEINPEKGIDFLI